MVEEDDEGGDAAGLMEVLLRAASVMDSTSAPRFRAATKFHRVERPPAMLRPMPMPMSLRLLSPLPTALVLALAGCPGDDGDSTTTVATANGSTTSAPTTDDTTATPPQTTTATTEDQDSSGAEETTAETTAAGPPQVVFETTLGTIVIELSEDLAPVTAANFIAYVESGFYDGADGLGATTVHRVVPGFVIQGGGLTEDLQTKATMAPIVNEFGNGLLNLRGTISMARTMDPDSATSQFFINLVDNDGLDVPPGYAVFGEVVQGLEVVDAIAAVVTEDMGIYEDVPVDPIIITSASVQ